MRKIKHQNAQEVPKIKNLLDYIEQNLKNKLQSEYSKQENLKTMNVITADDGSNKFQRFKSFTDSKVDNQNSLQTKKKSHEFDNKLFLSSKKKKIDQNGNKFFLHVTYP